MSSIVLRSKRLAEKVAYELLIANTRRDTSFWHSVGLVRIGPLELKEDLSAADWIIDRIHGFAEDVGSIVPEGFEAYARLFHPAARFENNAQVEVSWSDVAAANDRTVHPEMQWPNISGTWGYSDPTSPSLWSQPPQDGSLPRQYTDYLRDVLTEYTSTPDQVWFAVWEGFGGLKLRPGGTVTLSWGRKGKQREVHRPPLRPPPGPTFQLPNRAYYLLSGPIEGIGESMCEGSMWQSANLWWPNDRAWCVATEIDFSWTYIAGSSALVEALISHPELEVLPARIDHAITYEADQINPQPPRP